MLAELIVAVCVCVRKSLDERDGTNVLCGPAGLVQPVHLGPQLTRSDRYASLTLSSRSLNFIHRLGTPN